MRKKSSKIIANRHCEEQEYLPSQKQSMCKTQWPWHQGTQTWAWMWHNLLACSAGQKPLELQLLKILNEKNE